MTLFAEVLIHAISLDLGWFIGLFMNNLLWLFLFGAVAYFVLGKTSFKGILLGAIIISFYLFAIDDFMLSAGWVYQSGFFFAAMLGLIATTAYDSFFPKCWSFIQRGVFASGAFYSALIFINVVL